VTDRTKILIAALVVAATVAGWYTLGSDDSGTAPAPARSGGFDPDGGGTAPMAARRPTGTAPVRDVITLRVSDLEHAPRTYTPGRDPWRFVDPPPPPPPKPHVPTQAELDALRRAEEERRRAEEEARRQALIPKPPPFTWTYLGSFGPADRRIAVFTDGKTIYNAEQGETMAGKFIVKQIGYESVDIGFVNFPDVQRLPVGH
jgi:hypothetical protein